MKIQIEFLTEENGTDFKGWKVTYGDKYADGLGYDEMLGLIAAITMPEPRPTLQWLKTKEQHEAARNRYKIVEP
jgi:hypothetical protein